MQKNIDQLHALVLDRKDQSRSSQRVFAVDVELAGVQCLMGC